MRRIILGFLILSTVIAGCIERPTEYKYEIPEEIKNLPSAPLPTYNDLQSARSDYQWKLDLVKEQTQRLDMYYAAKSGESQTQREYRAWLDDLTLRTNEFIKRNLEAIRSGNAYIKFLNADNKRFTTEYTSGIISYDQYRVEYDFYEREYDRIVKNNEIMKDDTKKVVNNLQNQIDRYNSAFVK